MCTQQFNICIVGIIASIEQKKRSSVTRLLGRLDPADSVIIAKSVYTQWEKLHLRIQVQINDSGHLENSVLKNFTWIKLTGSNHHC